MGKIRLLADDVASQVAAGEVVERPASVVKELVENAIDAGAQRITVEFARGGAQRIVVTDDGSGMDREDALLCLERHATSKIRSAEDLATVGTMGFRGEAVPSIASVSRFRLTTRTQGADVGTEILVSGGKIESVSDHGGAEGTSVEVASLFFNMPARRKFLRGEETEAAHIVQQMQSLAIAHPRIAMSVLRDGRRLWQAAATTDLAVRIRDLFGADFLSRLLAIEPVTENGVTLSGFIARPGEGRPDRDQQFVVLNGRVIQCPDIFQSLREAYSESLPRGRHPLAVLCVAIDPMGFDCNVHPAKREIRLHRPDLVRQAVFETARKRLEEFRKRGAAPLATAVRAERVSLAPEQPAVPPARFSSSPQPELAVPVERSDAVDEGFRVLSALGAHWILMESAEGLVLLDVRAASERILFETLRSEAAAGTSRSQRLLLPDVVELTAKDFVWISENLAALETAGFHLEPFGGTSFKIEALPACLADRDARGALLDLCEILRSSGSSTPGPQALDALIRSVCRLAALDRFDFDEPRARRLVRELLACELPYACPQGRPTMIQWSFPELERKFGRG